MGAITIIQFLFDQCWTELDVVLNFYKTQGSIKDSIDVFDVNELTEKAFSKFPCIVVANIGSTRDLSLIVQFIKNNRNKIKTSNMKIVVLNRTGNKEVESALSKIGITDILEPHLKDKALKFKFDIWFKNISLGVSIDKEKDENEIEWGNPIDCAEDFWIVKHKDECKNSRNKWVVKMVGPNPHLGDWVIFEGKTQWCFKLKENTNLTNKSSFGQWIFEGEHKPEYLWKEDQWLFSSSKMSLFYVGTRSYDRFRSEKNKMFIAHNSPQALAKEMFFYSSVKRKGLYQIVSPEEAEPIAKEVLQAPKINVFFQLNHTSGNIHYMAKIDDLFEDQLVLKTQKGSYQVEADYTVHVKLEYQDQKEEYTISAHLHEIFSENDEVYLCFIVDPTEVSKLSFFFESLNSRQDNINEFLLKAKGY